MTIEPNSTIETRDASYTLISPAGAGGFGTVWRAVRDGDGESFAVKFMLEPEIAGMTRRAAKELAEKCRARFDHEIAIMDELNDIALAQEWADEQGYSVRTPQPFPEYVDRGDFKGLPFYVMEWLDPVNLYELDTDEKRVKFVSELCDAVDTLHAEGYVHYDIKPANVMRRDLPEGSSGYEYVLVDFGSVHTAESHPTGAAERPNASRTLSMLHDGRRVYPHTPGYADPTDDLHTVHGDIYAIGQVIRDLFAEEVPLIWGALINKCTSRNTRYRYATVKDIKAAVAALVKSREKAYFDFRADRIRINHDHHLAIAKSRLVRTTWDEILERHDPKKFGGLKVWQAKIGPSRTDRHCPHYRITEPLRIPANTILLVSGGGILEADITGERGSAVVVRAYATILNQTRQLPPKDQVHYVVGGTAYLNFARMTSASIPKFNVEGRVFRDLDEMSGFCFGGPKTYHEWRQQTIRQIGRSALPRGYRAVLKAFFKSERFLLVPDGCATTKA